MASVFILELLFQIFFTISLFTWRLHRALKSRSETWAFGMSPLEFNSLFCILIWGVASLTFLARINHTHSFHCSYVWMERISAQIAVWGNFSVMHQKYKNISSKAPQFLTRSSNRAAQVFFWSMIVLILSGVVKISCEVSYATKLEQCSHGSVLPIDGKLYKLSLIFQACSFIVASFTGILMFVLTMYKYPLADKKIKSTLFWNLSATLVAQAALVSTAIAAHNRFSMGPRNFFVRTGLSVISHNISAVCVSLMFRDHLALVNCVLPLLRPKRNKRRVIVPVTVGHSASSHDGFSM